MSKSTFAELGLPSEMVEVLKRNLITEPFEIQSLTIPDAMDGLDILGRAPTGSGKTLAFGLPMLAKLQAGSRKAPRGLVLSPTRELADQIRRELEPLAAAMGRNILAVYGGVGLNPQIKALRAGVDLLVACPGRLIDLINQGEVRLDEVDQVVVDEADRMADMGFLPDVRRLLDQTSKDRQTVLFSATLDNEVKVLIDRYQNDPIIHEVGEAEPDLNLMEHRFIKVKKTERTWLAADVIQDAGGPTVVFVRTRHGVDRLARQLKNEGIKAGYIHGGRSQSQRDRALKVFIDGKVDALVATDVAARGIHVDGVACVIHYDPPADIKDYVHRSGRTARAGAAGVVVSFLDPPQVKESEKMQRKLGLDAEIEPVPARKPRSSRPEKVDDRNSDAPKRQRNTGENKKPKGPKKSSGPKRGSSDSSARSGGPRSNSARSDSSRSDSRPARSDKRSDSSRPAKRSDSSRSDRSEGRDDWSDRRSDSSRPSRSGKPSKPGKKRTFQSKSSKPGSRTTGESAERSNGSRSESSGKPGKKSSTRKPGKAVARKSSGSKPGKSFGGKAGAGKGAGAKAAKGSKDQPTSKRTGKPRPKNRKNKPKATGRR